MSLFRSIESGQEHRKHYKQYLYNRYWCMSCCNHNPRYKQCDWCKDNRLHNTARKLEASRDAIREYLSEAS